MHQSMQYSEDPTSLRPVIETLAGLFTMMRTCWKRSGKASCQGLPPFPPPLENGDHRSVATPRAADARPPNSIDKQMSL